MLWLAAVTLLAIAALGMAEAYAWIRGARLRWPYLWAAHGLLLFGRREPRWEHPPEAPRHP